jgi:two-component system OmpR family response regulator
MIHVPPKNVFIVDDDPMTAEALRDYLSTESLHLVSLFNTGESCLPNLSQNPDFVILDYHLNSVEKQAANGFEILQYIKKNHPHIRIIMLSSQAHYAVALQTLKSGAENYVIKDLKSFEEILRLINK